NKPLIQKRLVFIYISNAVKLLSSVKSSTSLTLSEKDLGTVASPEFPITRERTEKSFSCLVWLNSSRNYSSKSATPSVTKTISLCLNLLSFITCKDSDRGE